MDTVANTYELEMTCLPFPSARASLISWPSPSPTGPWSLHSHDQESHKGFQSHEIWYIYGRHFVQLFKGGSINSFIFLSLRINRILD